MKATRSVILDLPRYLILGEDASQYSWSDGGHQSTFQDLRGCEGLSGYPLVHLPTVSFFHPPAVCLRVSFSSLLERCELAPARTNLLP